MAAVDIIDVVDDHVKIPKKVVDVFDDDYYANEEDDDNDADDDDDFFGDNAMENVDSSEDDNDAADGEKTDADNGNNVADDCPAKVEDPEQIIKLEVDDVTFEENSSISDIIPAIEIDPTPTSESFTVQIDPLEKDPAVSRTATIKIRGSTLSSNAADTPVKLTQTHINTSNMASKQQAASTRTNEAIVGLMQSDNQEFTKIKESMVPGSSLDGSQLVGNLNTDNELDHAYTSPQKNSKPIKDISLKAIINPPDHLQAPKRTILTANPVKKSENYIDKLRDIINAPDEYNPKPHPVSYIFKTFPPNMYIDQPVITFQGNSLNTGPMTLRSASQIKTETLDIKTEPLDATEDQLPRPSAAKKHVCDVCGKVFTGWSSWNRHKTVFFKDMHWKCDLCHKAFHTLHASKKDNHGCLLSIKEKVYKCDICSKVYKNGRSWRNHHRTAHLGLAPYRSKKKPKPVTDPSNNPPASNKPRKLYPCDVCGKKLKDSTSLKRHKTVYFPHMHYTCKKCNKSFHNLYDSKTGNHGCGLHVKGRIWHCDICDIYFKCGKSLKYHHKSKHLNLKPYQCDICGKSFKSSAFRYHMRRHHAKTKDITCHICGKAYAIDRDLKIHIQYAHENPNTFCCEVCHYTSRSRMAVIVHMRTHTGEKPFSCDVCGKAFATKCTLERHTPIHTGSKPYECDQCEKTFPYKAALNKHVRVHHSEQPRERYGCELCNETFSTKFIVKRHYKRKHARELNENRVATDNVVLEQVDDLEFIDALNYQDQ